ncbi:MAG: hypothetical protein K2J80_09670 [Oscillospiraceae bacterium]|nr:hypothetical protein [Oscillospiraceae bacterium]
MNKTAWIKSLLISVITAIASIVIIMTGVGVSSKHVFTSLFGLLLGGILPIILVAALKKDLSKYFIAKMILLVLTAVTYVLYFTPLEKFVPLFTDSVNFTFI